MVLHTSWPEMPLPALIEGGQGMDVLAPSFLVQAERAEKKRSDDATKDSVKKLNASVEKTTLGDISGLAELKAQMEAAAEKPKKAAAKKSAKAEEASAETEE